MKIFNPTFLKKHDLITYKVALLLINDYTAPEMLQMLGFIPKHIRGNRIARSLLELIKLGFIENIDFDRWNFKYSTLIYSLSDQVQIQDSCLDIQELINIDNIYKMMFTLGFEFTEEMSLKYDYVLYKKINNFCEKSGFNYAAIAPKEPKVYFLKKPKHKYFKANILIRKV
jgi:hypothetical protein